MQARRLTIMGTVVAAALALTTAACSSNGTTGTAGQHQHVISVFGTDGIMSNGFGDTVKVAGVLNGVSGTAALNPPNPQFSHELTRLDPSLDDFSYAGQAYDAALIVALAADMAHSVKGTDIAKYIDAVTSGTVTCTSYSTCLHDIAKGDRIAYRGITITSGFTKAGEPSTASYGTLHFGSDNHLDPQKTEFVNAGDDANAASSTLAPVTPGMAYNGPAMKLGLLLPETGFLSEQGKPIIAGAHYAVKEINAAGGVLGKPLTSDLVNDGSTIDKTAKAGAEKLVGDGVSAIVGPAASGTAANDVLPVTMKAGVVIISPSATSASLSTIPSHGLFFRTAPSDILQSQALADVITRTGAQRVYIVARNDTYGLPFAKTVTADLEQDGVPAANIVTTTYPGSVEQTSTQAWNAIAAKVKASGADAVLPIGYEETSGLIVALSAAGLTFSQN